MAGITQSKPRGHWTSQLTFILAATGAAVGLGNIWKFPYMAGDNGGSAFVVIYLICVVLIGLPVMLSEMLIGRRTRANPVDALSNLAKESNSSRHWALLGWWGLLGLLVTLSFYSVVAGWSVFYIYQSIIGAFAHATNHQIVALWQGFLANPTQLLLYHGIFMLITMLVVAKGVQAGLERASVIMMPTLFLILLALVIFAFVTSGPNFSRAAHFLFDFRMSQVTPAVVINALGHAFFTLAVGVGAMEIYGSYIDRKTSLGQSVVVIAILDVLVALLAGLAIFPLLFQYHLSPQQGPGLMFVVLPMAFIHMTGGSFIGCLFFVLLLFAAWTSSINIAEPLIAMLYEKTRLSRAQACWIIGILAWLMGIASVLSFNVWQHVRLFGQFDIFTAITDLSTNVFLPVGGIFYALFAGWVMMRKDTKAELAFQSNGLYGVWRVLIRYVAPIAILVVLVSAFC